MRNMCRNVEMQATPLQRIPGVSVVKTTFDYLLSNILNGTWKHGDKIPSENELRVILNVSRHTIRQAIANLNMLGILESRQGDGNYVQEVGIGLYADFLIPHLLFNKNNISQLIEFREAVEISAAYYAALRATEDDLKQIEEKFRICEENKHDTQNYPSFDMDFHLAIAVASKNELLRQSLSVIEKNCFDAIKGYFDASLAEQGVGCHQKIYEAIVRRDADSAKAYMMQHMQNIFSKVNK